MPLDRIAGAAPESRSVEGRLTATRRFAPYAPHSHDEARTVEALRAGAEIYAAAVERADPASLDALGQLLAIEGKAGEAVLRFEEALDRAPDDARTLSNLSAVALERGSPRDAIVALDAAERSVSLDPELVEASFNRALALERIGLLRAAAAEWESYAAREPDAAWASEARERGLALRTRIDEGAPERAVERFERALDADDTDAAADVVRTAPGALRTCALRQYLPAWAAAVLGGDPTGASVRSTRLTVIGDELERTQGDTLIAEIAGELVSGAPRVVARGYRRLADGDDFYEAREYERAAIEYAAASALLGGAGDDAGLALSEHGRVRCSVYAFDYSDVLSRSARVRRLCERRRFAHVEAKSRFVEAAAHLARGESGLAESENLRAASDLERLGDYETAVLAYTNATGAAQASFDSRRTIERQALVLRAYAAAGSPERLAGALVTFGQAEADVGAPYAGLRLLDEAVAALGRTTRTAELAFAHLYRGDVLDGLGRAEEAEADLERAEALTARLRPNAASRMLAGIELRRARREAATDPSASLAACDQVASLVARGGDRSFDLELRLARATALRASGELGEAERELGAAIEDVERSRAQSLDAPDATSIEAMPHPAFAHMISLLALDLNRPEDAFDTLERARARGLLDAIRKRPGRASAGPLTSERLRAELPAGVAVLEYAVLPDRTLTFVVTHEATSVHAEAIEASKLERACDGFRDAVTGGATTAEATARATRAYDLLVRPIASWLPRDGTCVVVPDSVLEDVPFAGLLDDRSGRFFVEDQALVVAPSASAYVACEAELVSQPTGFALAFGDPRRAADAEPLPAAESEAEALGRLYPAARVFVGAGATREAFERLAPQASVVHFAGHARPEGLSPRLLFASSGATDGESSSLGSDEILRLGLDATRLVVLSACSTAGARSESGGVRGLAAPFLAAGARSVVVSLWDVDDDAADALMRRFHERFAAGDGCAIALASAQRAVLRESPSPVAELRRWAAFRVVGAASVRRDGPDDLADGADSSAPRPIN